MEFKRGVAIIELSLMLLYVFSFSYLLDQSSGGFRDAEAETRELREDSVSAFKALLVSFLNKAKQPMFQLVSAHASFEDFEEIAGCCALTTTGKECATSTREQCASNNFLPGVLCEIGASYCRKGCCYNEAEGAFDSNTLAAKCMEEGYVFDTEHPSCDFPDNKANKGCCVLGKRAKYETYGACVTDTESLALGINSQVDWRGDYDELECSLLTTTFEEGACVLQGGLCSFGTAEECVSKSGDFYEGYLCTSPSLDTDCGSTDKTLCVEGKDGVYFRDTCGNPANIYDATRVNDAAYWDRVAQPEKVCGFDDDEGSANSQTCGNCDRFLGGICSGASADNFEPQYGDYYCKDTSCVYDGPFGSEYYENGESWCVYDGKVGEGDDVPGSKHWKYICNYGEVEVGGCADARGEVCIQSKEVTTANGETVPFSSAECIINNGISCLGITDPENEEWQEECLDALHCRIHQVNIDDNFQFEVCAPEYPRGFSLSTPEGQSSADAICGFGSQTCTVVYEADTWGGCHIAANAKCLTQDYAQQMNDLCRGLGDCGAGPNWGGDYSENIKVRKNGELLPSPYFNEAWKNDLVRLAQPVEGNYAAMEDYSRYLETLGLIGGEGQDDPSKTIKKIGYGVGGLGIAIGSLTSGTVLAGTNIHGLGLIGPGAASFANTLIGAAVGMFVGLWIADLTGASPGGTILLATGGALVGGVIGYSVWVGSLASVGPVGWTILAVGVVLMVIGALLSSDCENVEVQFVCEAWEPPSGGNNCGACNEDSMQPCTSYRCNSLGAACAFIPESGVCFEDNPDDVAPPIISFNSSFGDGEELSFEQTGTGVALSTSSGDCLDPELHTPLLLNLELDEPAICAWDTRPVALEEMGGQILPSGYTYEHSAIFPLYDPSGGESTGVDVSENVRSYIKCQDTHGTQSIDYFTVDFCLKEGTDTRPPIISKLSPASGGLVSFDAQRQDITVYTKAPATCRWDSVDVTYESMQNEMDCMDDILDISSLYGYECTGEVATLGQENTYYIRCLDQPWLAGTVNEGKRNANQQSTKLVLNKPSGKISIVSLEPESGEFETGTALTGIDVKVRTAGGGTWHKCSFSLEGYDSMIEMWETGGSTLHVQPLTQSAGRHTVYVECRDETGDSARADSTFTIIHDTTNPLVSRLWQDLGVLHLVTTEASECKYSLSGCGFDWEEGAAMGNGAMHTADVAKGNTYSIKCKDEFGNVPGGCSISVTIP